MKLKAILTFDLEFWYNSQFLKKYLPKDKNFSKDYIEESIEPILNLLTKHNQKATFFVLGQVAEKYPEVIKRISQAGHEIASHGYSHKILFELEKEEFEKEILKTNKLIKEIINQEPIGFRAPNFSLNHKTKWALEILSKHGFQYDSSIHPLSFKKTFDNPSIKELPCFLGGIYFRLLPLRIYAYLTKLFNKTEIPMVYFHPNELFDSTPKIKSAPWFFKKVKYWGTKSSLNKFEKLLKEFNFISIKQYLDENLIN